MKKTYKLFQIGLRQTIRDGMLLMLIPAPFLLGFVLRILMPIINELVWKYFAFSIKPWYPLADGMMLTLTPMLPAIGSAFLLLEERDEGIGGYYQITPIQGYSYLSARIGFPMLYAFISSLIVTALFGLSGLTFMQIFEGGIISTLMGIALSMLVVSFANNKVEGLAISKLSGIFLLGIFVTWFVPVPYKYLGAFLPSFWVGEILWQGTSSFLLLSGLSTSILYIITLIYKFLNKI